MSGASESGGDISHQGCGKRWIYHGLSPHCTGVGWVDSSDPRIKCSARVLKQQCPAQVGNVVLTLPPHHHWCHRAWPITIISPLMISFISNTCKLMRIYRVIYNCDPLPHWIFFLDNKILSLLIWGPSQPLIWPGSCYNMSLIWQIFHIPGATNPLGKHVLI